MVLGEPVPRWSAVGDGRYNPQIVARVVYEQGRWWSRASLRVLRDVVQAARAGLERRLIWPEVADFALTATGLLGALGHEWHAAWARTGRRRYAPVRLLRLASEPTMELWDPASGEPYEVYKARVFWPLRQSVVSTPTAVIDRYVSERLPPIVRLTDAARRLVGDTVARGQSEEWSDADWARELNRIERWGDHRVNNIVRTETSTMYNAGRFAAMRADAEVIGYRYQATLDLRTTDLCRAIDGKTVREGDVYAIPPLHYQCRTVVEPVFSWEEAGTSWDTPGQVPQPGVGAWQAPQYQGFGQRELLARLR